MKEKTIVSIKIVYADRQVGKASIMIPSGDLTVANITEDIFMPLLKAVGFQEKSINKHLKL